METLKEFTSSCMFLLTFFKKRYVDNFFYLGYTGQGSDYSSAFLEMAKIKNKLR